MRPSAVFLAEMLAPVLANPVLYWAPLFPGLLYGAAHGIGEGCAAAFLVGVPVALAAACVGKAIEIAVVLRLPLRIRGAVIGVIGWLGYASQIALMSSPTFLLNITPRIGHRLDGVASFSWPWLGWFLGQNSQGHFSFWRGVATTESASLAIAMSALAFAAWGANQGLTAPSGTKAQALGPRSRRSVPMFAGNALFRKELLWFRRDPSAVVQCVLVRLVLAATLLVNMDVPGIHFSWNLLCGAAVLTGTYFLLVLGPKTLASEGNALWIALTWPTGLEGLLKAKARLWSGIASSMVGLGLIVVAILFPANLAQIAIVSIGWLAFPGPWRKRWSHW